MGGNMQIRLIKYISIGFNLISLSNGGEQMVKNFIVSLTTFFNWWFLYFVIVWSFSDVEDMAGGASFVLLVFVYAPLFSILASTFTVKLLYKSAQKSMRNRYVIFSGVLSIGFVGYIIHFLTI